MVERLQSILRKSRAIPPKRSGGGERLKKALESFDTGAAYDAVGKLHIDTRSKEVVRTYLDLYRADFRRHCFASRRYPAQTTRTNGT